MLGPHNRPGKKRPYLHTEARPGQWWRGERGGRAPIAHHGKSDSFPFRSIATSIFRETSLSSCRTSRGKITSEQLLSPPPV